MKKIKERLNTRGFTLVELIVVIVIVLILAAALVPNVMRYINQARESAFQAEAAAYLVELQGYEAECYAKNNADLNDVDPNTSAAAPNNTYWKTNNSYVLSGSIGDPTFVTTFTSGTGLKNSATASGVSVCVKEGVVEAFGYANGYNFVNWEQSKGWTDIDKSTW